MAKTKAGNNPAMLERAKRMKAEHEKKTKKASSSAIKGDLDSLFNSKKNEKSKTIKKEKKLPKTLKLTEKAPEKKEVKKSGPTKYTEEGFKIYSATDLKLGQGKDTPDCPFDCDCCF